MVPSACLFVEVPICAFRPFASREYQDTYSVPPPSAVYGMLLSLVGVPRQEMERHRGVAMVLAVESLPGRSRVFRKLRRGEEEKTLVPTYRPDYQDILVDLRLWVWLATGGDKATPDLPSRVVKAIESPSSVERYGGLSLGESSYLVDSICLRRTPPAQLTFLEPNPRGFHHLTTWVDHADGSNTRSVRFSLSPMTSSTGIDLCWIEVGA